MFPRKFFVVECGRNVILCCADLLWNCNLFNWRKKLIIACKNMQCNGIAFSRNVVIVRFEVLCWGFKPSSMWCCIMRYEVLMFLGPQSFRMLINTHPVILHHIPENWNPYSLWTEFTVTLHSYLMGLEPHPSLVSISGRLLPLCWVSLKVTVFFFRSRVVYCVFWYSSHFLQKLMLSITSADIVSVQVSDYSRLNYESCNLSTWGESV